MRRLLILLSLIALGFAWAIPAAEGAGSYDFTTFDVPFTAPFPGAVNTLGLRINISGQVVGAYANGGFGIVQGFLRDANGNFTQIAVPFFPSTFQWPRDMNDFGVIVGRYRTFDGRHGGHCFGMQAGSFVTFDVPFPNTFGTRCSGINDLDQIVGIYFTSHFHSFVLNPNSGSVSLIADLSTDTLARRINNEGQIVGTYIGADGRSHGFLLSGGTSTTIDAGSYAATQKIIPPATPADITPPAGNSVFLVGHAVGTQGYVCLPTSTGASWTVNASRPEAILSASSSGQDFEITHFLSPNTNPNSSAPTPLPFGSPTWRSSLDGSVVWAKALTPPVASGSDASCPNSGAIPCLLLQAIGSKTGPGGGKSMTQTTFIQRLNTTGGTAPASGCSAPADVGKQALVPYTADYYFFNSQ